MFLVTAFFNCSNRLYDVNSASSGVKMQRLVTHCKLVVVWVSFNMHIFSTDQ